jgi:hypothetical protein
MSTTGLSITRTELGLPDLDLLAGGFSDYGTITFTEPTLDRSYPSTVPWVHYERPTHVRRTNGSYTVPIRVQGTDPAHLAVLLAEVKAAFSQIEFTVRHTYGGITTHWSCIAADINNDQRSRNFDAAMAAKHVRLVQFTGPHRGEV